MSGGVERLAAAEIGDLDRKLSLRPAYPASVSAAQAVVVGSGKYE